MLFNPKWSEAKPDVFSTEGLAAWLEKQPADSKYNYCEPGGCLLAHYFAANGLQNPQIASNYLYEIIDGRYSKARIFPRAMNDVAHYGFERNRTYGGALKYALKVLAKS